MTVSDDRLQQALLMLEGSGVGSSLISELLCIEHGVINQRIHLEVSPEIFNGVEIRCGGREMD